jgi:hypothetical protein
MSLNKENAGVRAEATPPVVHMGAAGTYGWVPVCSEKIDVDPEAAKTTRDLGEATCLACLRVSLECNRALLRARSEREKATPPVDLSAYTLHDWCGPRAGMGPDAHRIVFAHLGGEVVPLQPQGLCVLAAALVGALRDRTPVDLSAMRRSAPPQGYDELLRALSALDRREMWAAGASDELRAVISRLRIFLSSCDLADWPRNTTPAEAVGAVPWPGSPAADDAAYAESFADVEGPGALPQNTDQ